MVGWFGALKRCMPSRALAHGWYAKKQNCAARRSARAPGAAARLARRRRFHLLRLCRRAWHMAKSMALLHYPVIIYLLPNMEENLQYVALAFSWREESGLSHIWLHIFIARL